MLIVCESYLYSLQICIRIWYNTIIKTAIKCDIRCKIKPCNCRLFSWATYHAPVAELAYAEARDLLIPQLRKLRVGWNGNFGISNAGLAYNSKLAYEMLKAILYACRQGDGTVLKVTDEPLMYAPGKSNIHAL